MSRGPARHLPAIDLLETRVQALVASHRELAERLAATERELDRLRQDVARYGRERAELRARLDAALAEADAAVGAVAGT
jgi:chromosome segregation ATPase